MLQKISSVAKSRFESYELEIVQVLMWEDGIFTTITCPEVPQNNSHYFHQTGAQIPNAHQPKGETETYHRRV